MAKKRTPEPTHDVEAAGIGPIPESHPFRFNFGDPGVVVIQGPNGAGKSTLLSAVRQGARGGKQKLPLNDKAHDGYVHFRGVNLIIGPRSTRCTGEMECHHIEDHLKLSAFVDPGIKDPEKADAARIKSLMAMTGVVPDSAPYREEIGEADWKELGDLDENTDDAVELARRVRSVLHQKARELEASAEDFTSTILSLKDQIQGVPTDIETDAEILQQNYDSFAMTYGALVERDNASRNAATTRSQTASEIDRILDSLKTFRPLDEMDVIIRDGDDRIAMLRDRQSSLQDELTQVSEQLELECERVDHVRTSYQLRSRNEEYLSSLREALESIPSPVPVEEIESALRSKQEAMDSIRAGERARAALDAAEQLGRIQARQDTESKAAERFRDHAASVDKVMAGLIKTDHVDVDVIDGQTRLVVPLHKRGTSIPFGDLSEGERNLVAITIGAEGVGRGGVIVLDQEGWEPLDGNARRSINQLAHELGVYVLTAEASRDTDADALEAIPYSEESNE